MSDTLSFRTMQQRFPYTDDMAPVSSLGGPMESMSRELMYVAIGAVAEHLDEDGKIASGSDEEKRAYKRVMEEAMLAHEPLCVSAVFHAGLLTAIFFIEGGYERFAAAARAQKLFSDPARAKRTEGAR